MMRSALWVLGLTWSLAAWGQESDGDEAPAEPSSEEQPAPTPPSDSDDSSPETSTSAGESQAPLAVPVQPQPTGQASQGVRTQGGVVGGEPPVEDASRAQFHLPEGWDWEPYWRPIFSLTGVGNAYVYRWPMTLGALGGVRAWDTESPLQVSVRGQATSTFGSGALGSDFRAGAFIGPSWEFFNVMVGPDLFRNTYRINNYPSAGYVLEPSIGLDFTALVTVGPEDFYALAGVTPALLLNPDRRVDWDEVGLPGVGHEFQWVIGLISNTGPFRLGLVYSRRVLANGVQQGWGVSAGF